MQWIRVDPDPKRWSIHFITFLTSLGMALALGRGPKQLPALAPLFHLFELPQKETKLLLIKIAPPQLETKLLPIEIEPPQI